MSGGVDSSVTAALLKEEGHSVIGLFMKNWEESDAHGVCQASKEYDDVLRTCDVLGIPCYSVNFAKEYQTRVFDLFLRDLKAGLTPNPDVLCNREIKFDLLLAKALSLGADFLATGHYCRKDEQNRLLKGSDPGKDQSYFLYLVKPEILSKVLFPVGHLRKQEVRALSRKFGLPTSEKKDSTGICFIGKRDFKTFVAQYLGYQPGPFQTLDGATVGQHDGCAYYTIGQRRGMGLGGEGDAWFVVGKDPVRNLVFVERGENHPALFASSLTASQLFWTGGSFPCRCSAKIRYRGEDAPCLLEQTGTQKWRVTFDALQRAITPGQSVVFYKSDLCLGGAIIN